MEKGVLKDEARGTAVKEDQDSKYYKKYEHLKHKLYLETGTQIEENKITDRLLEYALKHNLEVNMKPPLKYVVDNDLKIDGNLAFRYAIDHSSEAQAQEWLMHAIKNKLQANGRSILECIADIDSSMNKETSKGWVEWAKQSQHITLEEAKNLTQKIDAKTPEGIIKKYFESKSNSEKIRLNRAYRKIQKEQGKELLGMDSALGKFIDDPENLKALNTVARLGEREQSQLSQNNPLKDISPDVIYKNCDLKLLEKISTVSQNLDQNQDRDYSKLSTKQKIIVGISTILPVIGNLIAYGIIKSHNKGKEASQLNAASEKLQAPLKELKGIVQKEQGINQ